MATPRPNVAVNPKLMITPCERKKLYDGWSDEDMVWPEIGGN